MIKYRYTIENTTIETLDINSIPNGVNYETIEFEEIVEIQDNSFELKQIAHQQLLQTDWYVIRFIETGKPIPPDILELRNNIRNIS
jgi:hypothetical protein